MLPGESEAVPRRIVGLFHELALLPRPVFVLQDQAPSAIRSCWLDGGSGPSRKTLSWFGAAEPRR